MALGCCMPRAEGVGEAGQTQEVGLLQQCRGEAGRGTPRIGLLPGRPMGAGVGVVGQGCRQPLAWGRWRGSLGSKSYKCRTSHNTDLLSALWVRPGRAGPLSGSQEDLLWAVPASRASAFLGHPHPVIHLKARSIWLGCLTSHHGQPPLSE